MRVSRREFFKAAAAAVATGAVSPSVLADLGKILVNDDGPRVVWLQGAGCDGCAISFLNSVNFATVDDLLVNTIDLEYQSNLMAAAGDIAVSVAQSANAEPGYVLVIEGAIPVGAQGRYCMLWPGMSMHQALLDFAPNAAYIIALGACASFGGLSHGDPNPTEARSVGDLLGDDPRLINLPGCPAHPDWLVGTLTYLITTGHAPPLDTDHRPLEYYGRRIHDDCPNRAEYCGSIRFAGELGEAGCMEFLGCKGKKTYSDCPVRKWNSSGPGRSGVNWCIGAKSPCLGCVEPIFPEGMSPFYVYSPTPDTPVVGREQVSHPADDLGGGHNGHNPHD
jgi:NiFe hydrogenase small subunit HydA